ncbi:hypothetical protein CABS01_16518 [Colletotrichum abscissum]|uniref:uncharacterized protein n=1 Tax=Colletotrichum abscissum TaxID=1671311 RepID=UPI0027D73360|nr:uncharacterized protein CABS01_16518 [Colletotrichum abscissum]KAK1521588.1 hypothetical protein CABS01_16518 [Colletotrichum abscissum]
MTLSITLTLRLNGLQADVFHQPELCNEAHELGVQFLDMVEMARDFSSALHNPRPQKSRNNFLRFVFEQSHDHDQEATNRKLKLRALNGISLVLCAATYTKNSILGFSKGRFNILLAHCSSFLGSPAVVASKLPSQLIQTSLAAPIHAIDDVSYRRFRRDLAKLQTGLGATQASIDLGLKQDHGLCRRESTAWPKEQVSALLHGPQCITFCVVLRQIARLCKDFERTIPCSIHTIEALVTISKSGSLDDSMQLLDTAADMLTDLVPVSTWASVVHRRSIVLRLLGDPQSSEQELHTFIRRSPNLPGHLLIPLQLSLANNLIYQLKYTDAAQIVREIQVTKDLQGDQVQLIWDQIYCVGRVMRGQGDFESARICFEQCFKTYGMRKSKKIIIQTALADLYCELDYKSQDDQRYHLFQARSLLEPALESVGVANSKSRRRLLLSLSEINLREGRLHEARKSLEELLILYGGMDSFDVVDRLGHVRSYIALARTYPDGQAEPQWRNALRLNAEYNPSEEEVFTCAIIYLHLSWLSYCSGELNGAQNMYACAGKVLNRRRPEYLLPGVGTYVFDEIQCKLRNANL